MFKTTSMRLAQLLSCLFTLLFLTGATGQSTSSVSKNDLLSFESKDESPTAEEGWIYFYSGVDWGNPKIKERIRKRGIAFKYDKAIQLDELIKQTIGELRQIDGCEIEFILLRIVSEEKGLNSRSHKQRKCFFAIPYADMDKIKIEPGWVIYFNVQYGMVPDEEEMKAKEERLKSYSKEDREKYLYETSRERTARPFFTPRFKRNFTSEFIKKMKDEGKIKVEVAMWTYGDGETYFLPKGATYGDVINLAGGAREDGVKYYDIIRIIKDDKDIRRGGIELLSESMPDDSDGITIMVAPDRR